MKLNLNSVLFLSLLGLGLFGTTHSEARFGNDQLGATDPANTAEYVTAYNLDTVAHEIGDVVISSFSTTYGVGITSTTTANDAQVLGVIALKDCASGALCTVQVYGYHSAVTVGTVAVGDSLVTSSTAERADAYTVAQATGTAAGQSNDFGVFGVALSADSGGTAKVFLK